MQWIEPSIPEKPWALLKAKSLIVSSALGDLRYSSLNTWTIATAKRFT
jgi:hypothetical protein